MSLVINGVTIPTNVANALMVKGVSVTQVIANGVAVWTQSIGPTVGWSGQMLVAYISGTNTVTKGMETSGLNYRWMFTSSMFSSAYGPWVQYTNGAFSTSYYSVTGQVQGSGNSLRITTGTTLNTWVTYSPSAKTFSGTAQTIAGTTWGEYDAYETSGGLIRYTYRSTDAVLRSTPWVSLT